jgi:hypothetical protein
VVGVLSGYLDTDMAEQVNTPEIQPVEFVRTTLDALRTEQDEVYPSEVAAQIAALLLQDPKAVERQFAPTILGATMSKLGHSLLLSRQSHSRMIMCVTMS